MKRESYNLLGALILSSAVSVVLFATRAAASGSTRYSFLIWNLFLAWIPLGLAITISQRLRRYPWSNPGTIVVTLLWLGFLPNSFYIISDFVHVHATGEISTLFDSAMITSFAFNGLILGIMSLYILHKQLVKRIFATAGHAIVAGILLLCSFAIYLGRYLRWNTWDIIIDPAGLLFDVSDRLINPVAHPRTFSTTATFFLLLGSIYAVAYNLVGFIKKDK